MYFKIIVMGYLVKIIELKNGLSRKGPLKIIRLYLPCHGQGHLTSFGFSSPMQPGLEHFRDGASTISLGHLFQCLTTSPPSCQRVYSLCLRIRESLKGLGWKGPQRSNNFSSHAIGMIANHQGRMPRSAFNLTLNTSRNEECLRTAGWAGGEYSHVLIQA